MMKLCRPFIVRLAAGLRAQAAGVFACSYSQMGPAAVGFVLAELAGRCSAVDSAAGLAAGFVVLVAEEWAAAGAISSRRSML